MFQGAYLKSAPHRVFIVRLVGSDIYGKTVDHHLIKVTTVELSLLVSAAADRSFGWKTYRTNWQSQKHVLL